MFNVFRVQLIKLHAWLMSLWEWDNAAVPKHVPGQTVRMAGVRDPKELHNGCVVVAMKETGKTSLIKKNVNDALALGEPVYIVDVGENWAAHIVKMAPPGTPVRRVSVHTVGGLKIDWAKLLDRPSRIAHFARKLVKEKETKNPFFPSNAQLWMIAVVNLLNVIAPLEWELRDFLLLATNRKLFEAIMAQHPGAVIDPQSQFAHNDSARDVLGTVAGYLLPFQVFAALSEHSPAAVGLFDAFDQGGVTIFEWSDRIASSVESLYAAAIEMIADEFLSRQTDRRVWMVFDELIALQPLDCLTNVALRGRRSAMCFLWSFHSINGLWDRYGKDRANQMLDLMGTKVILKNDGIDTLDWASRSLGRCDFIVETDQTDSQGNVTSSRSRQEKYRVPAIDIYDLPYPDTKGAGLISGFVSDRRGAGPFSVPFVADCPRVSATPQDAPKEWEELKPFDLEDMKRLHVRIDNAVREALGL